MNSNQRQMMVRLWPAYELKHLFHTSSDGSFPALYQASSDTELTILVAYDADGEMQQLTIPMANILMYQLYETGADGDDNTTDNSGA